MIRGHLRSTDRGVLGLSGSDSRTFLQALISNDINKLTPEYCLYAALLTPQGKYLFDFFLYDDGSRILLDAQASRLADLQRRLLMYRLRAKCEIEDLSDRYAVFLALGDGLAERLSLPSVRGSAKTVESGVVAIDPRLAELGVRAVLPKETALFDDLEPIDPGLFGQYRMELGVAEGEPELVPQKSLLLESNFEELAGVDFDKGCFVGQELTARTKYRGLVKKRVLPVSIEGSGAVTGTPLLDGDREVGEIRAASGTHGLALIRLERVDLAAAPALDAGGAIVRVQVPDWLHL
ncbi:MAG: folate-binding protein [Pseudomonadota bacterium]